MDWIFVLMILNVMVELLFLILLCTSKYGDTIILLLEDLYKGVDSYGKEKTRFEI